MDYTSPRAGPHLIPAHRARVSMSTRSGHPSRALIEAAGFGQLGADEAARVRAHAASCKMCGPRLATEEETRRRLEVLRQDPPRVNVVNQVLERIDAHARQNSAEGAPDPNGTAPSRRKRASERTQ
jgi:hypothetical protein